MRILLYSAFRCAFYDQINNMAIFDAPYDDI